MRAMGKITSFDRTSEQQISTELHSLNETKAIELLKQVCFLKLEAFCIFPEHFLKKFFRKLFSGIIIILFVMFRKVGFSLIIFRNKYSSKQLR